MKCSSGVWAGLAFGVIFVGSIALMVGVTYNHRMAAKRNYEWWERSVIYHIFTPSFYDTDDDGFGDLRDGAHTSRFEPQITFIRSGTETPVRDDLGYHIRMILFTEYPEVQAKYFPMMSMNDVINLGAHGIKVLSDVGIMVRFVEEKNDSQLVAKITKVTQNHCKKGVGLVGFKVVTKTLHEYLAMSLGANLTPEGGKAWKKLLDTLLIVVEQELNRKYAQ